MYSIGLMSGTSMDGIDATLLDTDGIGHIVELGQTKLDYAPQTKRLLKAAERAINTSGGDLQKASLRYEQTLHEYLTKELQIDEANLENEISQLTTHLQTTLHTQKPLNLETVIQLSTELHAQAVKKLLVATGKQAREIDVIGYHGQTMFHKPAVKITVQVGDGALLAELTGITVVNDFRSRDVTAGGQGAPLAPIYHQALAKRDSKLPLAVVNCGGIANISLILGEEIINLSGFDTGPGNGLVDSLIRERTNGKEFMDRDGQYGSKGEIHEDVLTALFEQAIRRGETNYFLMPPPKSLDIRDMALIPAVNELSLEDACATLEAFTAEMIVNSLGLTNLTMEQIPRHWVLAGGGWYNPVIKEQLAHRLKETYGDIFTVETAQEAGWNSDTMEAQIFAHFAVRSLKKLPLSAPGTTGVPIPLSGGHAHIPPAGATPKVAALLAENPDVLRGYLPDPLENTKTLIEQHRASKTPPEKLSTIESPRPLTLRLAEEAQTDLLSSYEMLQEVDQQALHQLHAFEERINHLAEIFLDALRNKRNILIGGCGSAARAAMAAERLFREAFPDYADYVSAVIAGGDLILVRTIADFEDKPDCGHEQLFQAGWQPGDVYVGVTASGAAGYISGQIETILDHDTVATTKPIFFTCNRLDECLGCFADDPKTIFHRSKRERLAGVEFLDLCVGEMALSGSTRMQAATVQLAVLGFALLQAGQQFVGSEPLSFSQFMASLENSLTTLPLAALVPLTEHEVNACSNPSQYVAYHADSRYALIVATDTTERSPTFNQPYFENDLDPSTPPSPCRIIISGYTDNAEALKAMLGRELKALNWVNRPGKKDEPRTTLAYLLGYDLTENIKTKRKSMAGRSNAVDIFIEINDTDIQIRFSNQCIVVPVHNSLPKILLPLFQQLILKMLLNIHSTLVAGKMGYYHGNLMTSVSASNQKLINRAITLTEQMIASTDFSARRLPPSIKQRITLNEIKEVLYYMMLLYRPGESIVINTRDAVLTEREKMGYLWLFLLQRQNEKWLNKFEHKYTVETREEMSFLTAIKYAEVVTEGKRSVLCLEGGGTYFRFSVLSNKNQAYDLQLSQEISSTIKTLGGNCNAVGWTLFQQRLDDALESIQIAEQSLLAYIQSAEPIIVIGMAGMASESNVQKLITYFVEKTGINRKLICITSDVDAYLAGLPSQGGAILIAGTGSICVGLTPQGMRIRSGGLGCHLSGDPGSAFSVGKQAMIDCLNLKDGALVFDETTKKFIDKTDALYEPMMQAFEKNFGVSRNELVGYLNSSHERRPELAKVSEMVFAYAFDPKLASPLALKIITKTVEELAIQLATTIQAIFHQNTALKKEPFIVILRGGLFEGQYGEKLRQRLEDALNQILPGFLIDWRHESIVNYMNHVIHQIAPAPVYRFANQKYGFHQKRKEQHASNRLMYLH